MAKLVRSYWKTKDGEKKLNCYLVAVPKAIIEKTIKDGSADIEVVADGDRVIIKRAEES